MNRAQALFDRLKLGLEEAAAVVFSAVSYLDRYLSAIVDDYDELQVRNN